MSTKKKAKPKPPKITDFSKALLEVVHNEKLNRERLDLIEAAINEDRENFKSLLQHLGVTPVVDEQPEASNIVPFAAAGESVPVNGYDANGSPVDESDVH